MIGGTHRDTLLRTTACRRRGIASATTNSSLILEACNSENIQSREKKGAKV